MVAFVDWRDRKVPDSWTDVQQQCEREIEQRRLQFTRAKGIQFFLVVSESASAQLRSDLARVGIWIFVTALREPLEMVGDQIVEGLREQAHALNRFRPGSQISSARQPIGAAERQAYSSNPPGFDRQAFELYLRQLTQPWVEDDSWRSET